MIKVYVRVISLYLFTLAVAHRKDDNLSFVPQTSKHKNPSIGKFELEAYCRLSIVHFTSKQINTITIFLYFELLKMLHIKVCPEITFKITKGSSHCIINIYRVWLSAERLINWNTTEPFCNTNKNKWQITKLWFLTIRLEIKENICFYQKGRLQQFCYKYKGNRK